MSQISDLAGAGVEAEVYVEIKVELTGRFVPGEPATGPTFESGGEPGWSDSAEDIRVDGLWAATAEGVHSIDLLKDVDRKSAAWRKLQDNLIEAVWEDAQDAIVDAAQ